MRRRVRGRLFCNGRIGHGFRKWRRWRELGLVGGGEGGEERGVEGVVGDAWLGCVGGVNWWGFG